MSPSIALVLLLAFQAGFQINLAEQGLKALDEKRYQAAVDSFTQAIAANPKDYSLHFNLGLAYSLMGKNAEAIPEYKKTLELKPGLFEAELNVGISLLREKQPAEALPYLTDAVAQNVQQYRPNYYLAEALLGADEPAKAEQAYTAALAIDPKAPAAELGLAHALVKQEKLDAASTHYRKAAELDARYRDDLLELASMYEAAKQPEQAMSIYQQFPENPGAQERMGELLLKAGRPADAIPYFQASIAKSPSEANRAALAEAYLKNKQPENALPVVEQILAADPDNFEIRMLHGRIIRDQRKFPEAADEFVRATKLKPDAPQAWSELASVLVMAENYPSALAALDRVAALHAEKPGHVFLRAIVLDKMRDLKPALASYQRFLELSHGEFPNQEFQARQRAKTLEREISKQ
jgi:tetratricopeptide (TPR) repeat protein